jgi:DNA-binding beta-propeller fold protein YncE
MAVAALGLLVGLLAVPAASAAAISDGEALNRVGSLGSGPGELNSPSGIASDPVTGHLYTVEFENSRVSEFTPWGKFVKAFGLDVALGSVNEQQEVRIRAAGGQFVLEFGTESTGNLPLGASAAEVEAALNGLASIGAGGVLVEESPGATNGVTPYVYVVSFNGSPFAASNVQELKGSNGTTPLSGGNPSTTLVVRTRVDGAAPGSGLEACTEESGCKAGLQGSGPGQFERPNGVAVDSAGNVYVSEVGNRRVQKFDSAGRFISKFGDEAGPGQLGEGGGRSIALCPNGPVCPSGALFVADSEAVERFALDGTFEAQLPVPGALVEEVAFDPISEDLYATFVEKEGVHKLDSSTGAEIGAALKGSGPLATDAAGDVFVRFETEVLEYDSSGKALSPPSCCSTAAPFALTGLGTNGAGDLDVANYASGLDNFIAVYGPGPVIFEGPPKVPPEIITEFAASVQRDGATVAAEINSHFFADTHYFVQYGTGDCSAGGCQEETPAPPGRLLTTQASNRPLQSPGVRLAGLTPGTTYHYRFVAQSGGGGPVFGQEATFTTPDPLPRPPCPNDAFRAGAGAHLPDCRAYELVSPVDKNNGDIKTLLDSTGYATNLDQSAEDGNKLTYSSYRSFGDPQGAPVTNQYLAARGADGWSNQAVDPGLAPPSQIAGHVKFGATVSNPYKAFSPDLCLGWFMVAVEPLLDAGRDFANYPNIYRRDFCGGAGDEALIPVRPNVQADEFVPEPQGASADGKAAVFRVKDKLSQNAAAGVWQAYYTREGSLPQLLCILPDGAPSPGNCSAGTSGESKLTFVALGRLANVATAISSDGSKAYWTDSAAEEMGAGKVYLRLNPGQPQSALSAGQCTEAEKACTVKVSEPKSSAEARFLGASPDGKRALFEIEDDQEPITVVNRNLYEFELGSGSKLVAGKVVGVLGKSDDLSRIYFVSEEALSGAGKNQRGEVAKAGAANLYLDDEGTKAFIATLENADVAGSIPSDTAPPPIYHAARVNSDGSVLAFISSKSLSGYDNTDLVTGKADSEVYLYEVGATGSLCVSCNPSQARPRGRIVQGNGNSSESLSTAGSLPMPTTDLYFPRALSTDGKRLFFNSFDALLPRDTNGTEDVYEWEKAAGREACEQLGADLYVATAGGCLSLISSGESPQDSEFTDAAADGRDVFFVTNAGLLQQDPGLFDVYDARIGGGVPPPPSPMPNCLGEACKAPATAPNDPALSSSSYEGPVDRRKHRRKHHKQHRRKHHKQHKKKHHEKQRAGR